MGFNNSWAFRGLIQTMTTECKATIELLAIYNALIDTLEALDFDVFDELLGIDPLFDRLLDDRELIEMC